MRGERLASFRDLSSLDLFATRIASCCFVSFQSNLNAACAPLTINDGMFVPLTSVTGSDVTTDSQQQVRSFWQLMSACVTRVTVGSVGETS